MPSHWGEFTRDDGNSETNILPQSDFMLSTYRTNYSNQPGNDNSVCWTMTTNSCSTSKSTSRNKLAKSNLSSLVTRGVVQHTIELEAYRSELHILLGTAVHIISDKKELVKEDFSDPPPFPQCTQCFKQQTTSDQSSLNPTFTPESISPALCKSLVEKSVAQLCLHEGFTDARRLALDAFTSAVGVIYERILNQLRINVDIEAQSGHAGGYLDVMERTLAEIGHTDSHSLLSDYKTNIMGRHERLLNTCQQLYDMYEDVRRTKQVPAQYADILNISPSESEQPMSVLQLSDTEERSEACGSNMDQDDEVDEDDAQKLLELAGINGFDITIAADQDEDSNTQESETSEFVRTSPKSKGKSSKGSSAKRRRY